MRISIDRQPNLFDQDVWDTAYKVACGVADCVPKETLKLIHVDPFDLSSTAFVTDTFGLKYQIVLLDANGKEIVVRIRFTIRKGWYWGEYEATYGEAGRELVRGQENETDFVQSRILNKAELQVRIILEAISKFLSLHGEELERLAQAYADMARKVSDKHEVVLFSPEIDMA